MHVHYRHRLMILGGILADFRHAKCITTAQLAFRLSRPESFVLEYESGKYRLDLTELVDIADALGTDMIELIDMYQQRVFA